MTRRFIHTLLRFSAFGVAAILLLLVGYVYHDPYKVLRDRKDYSNDPPDVIANRDHISSTVYLNNSDERHYDSFIFGSSRCLAYKPSHWVRHLPPGAQPYLFNASGESVHGIAAKVHYLDSMGVRLKNVLVILCRDFSFAGKAHHTGPLFIKHPTINGGSWIHYHWTFLDAYLTPEFLAAFYANELTGSFKPWMSSVLANYKIESDPVTGEVSITSKEADILADPEAFYAERKGIFYERPEKRAPERDIIRAEHEGLLRRMMDIFRSHGTDLRVVIGPLYEQRVFSDRDLRLLRDVFGATLYDFSGVNAFTTDMHNYYETSHYRPLVGDSILKVIYPGVPLMMPLPVADP